MTFLSDTKIVLEALDEYYRQSISRERPVINQNPMENLIADLGLASHLGTGGLSGENLSRFLEKYLTSTTRLHHPGDLAHQVASPHYAGAIGALRRKRFLRTSDGELHVTDLGRKHVVEDLSHEVADVLA